MKNSKAIKNGKESIAKLYNVFEEQVVAGKFEAADKIRELIALEAKIINKLSA